MKKWLLLLLLLRFADDVCAQYSKYVIFFTDKNETGFSLSNPSAYLSAKSIARKTRYQVPIDSNDLPVVQRYVDSVRLAGVVTILGRSRWLNAVIIQTTDAAALQKINSFPFVKKRDSVAFKSGSTITPQPAKLPTINPLGPLNYARTSQTTADTFNYGVSSNQIKIHKGEFLHNIGARGQTMSIAFLDAGFTGFQTNRFFDSARNRNQILGTWDFVSGNSNVNEDHPHGLNCFSIVAAYIPGTFIGSCPEASYYLLRTEDAPTEQIIEEYNWVLGAEYADSAGADLISSSLGYTTFDNPAYDHSYADMNGNTTVISRMADLAAKKGILVVNSAGNDGSGSWRYIGAPADGDSVLSVGAVNNSGIIASFSSYGPTSDGQIKPDVVSVGSGTVLSNTSGNTTTGSGTSFSCPNMAGLAACLWQLFPEFNNWKIITTLRQSADRFNTPHEQYGYGLPNMKKAFGILVADASSMTATINNFTTTVNWSSKDISTMRYQVERKLPNESNYTVVQTVAATGNVVALRNYSVNDVISNSPAGTVSYRIRQVIDTSITGYDAYLIDSATVILSVATSTIDRNRTDKTIQLYPNPVTSSLSIKLNEQTAGNYLFQVFNQQGQLLITQSFNKPSGTITQNIPVNLLPKGNYILSVSKDGKPVATKEFTKQ
ncbi:S8 family serine peptidase [Lacibacter sp. MH-610]|uniref:S8 family serine peptidase n=1 Tax=Lacibacter sp. MH-610 TaxID=3020883 RepID=UPI0038916661